LKPLKTDFSKSAVNRSQAKYLVEFVEFSEFVKFIEFVEFVDLGSGIVDFGLGHHASGT
jgi:hypothetical protein